MKNNEEQLLTIKFDGACDNNSKLKFMGIGVAVWIDGKRDTDLDFTKMAGSGTNNIAEWEGLVEALKMAYAYMTTVNPNIRVRIYGDSQLIVYQFNGRYEIKKEEFLDYYKEAKRLRNALGGRLKRVEWIPRKDNGDADILSKKAIRDYLVKNNMI